MSEPLIHGGYILLSRKIIESQIWSKPPLFLKVWVYLLSKAQHSDYKQLKRGQLRTSIPEIIEACSWKSGYRTEKPTKDQIFQVLEWLRNEHGGGHGSNDGSNTKESMVTTTRATHGMLINIDNYCFYQTPENYGSNDGSNEKKDTGATTGEAREQRQPDNINKNVKNDKNDQEKDIDEIHTPLAQIIDCYSKIRGIHPINVNGTDIGYAQQLTDSVIPIDFIISTMQETSKDKDINSMSYFFKTITGRWKEQQQVSQEIQGVTPKSYPPRTGKRTPIKSEYLEKLRKAGI